MATIENVTEAAKVGLDIAKFGKDFFDHCPSKTLRVINNTKHEKITVRSYASHDAIMSYSSTDAVCLRGGYCDVAASTPVIKVYAARGDGYSGYFGSYSNGPWTSREGTVMVITDRHMS